MKKFFENLDPLPILLKKFLHRLRSVPLFFIPFGWMAPFLFVSILPYLPPILYGINYFPPVAALVETMTRGERAMRDMLARYGRKAPVDPRLVYIAIDSASLKLDQFSPEEIEKSPGLTLMSKSWPWPRTVYSLIFDRLFQSGARAVAVDLLFLTSTSDDASLHNALERYHDKLTIGANYVNSRRGNISSISLDLPVDDIVAQTQPLDPRVAFVNFFPDSDGVIRRANYAAGLSDDSILPSLAAATLRKAGFANSVPTEPKLIRFAGGAGTYVPISAYLLFDPVNWKTALKNGAVFKDKIVLIGPEGDWSQDEHPTPLGVMPGPEVHMNAMGAALNHDFLREAPWYVNFLVLIFTALMAWAVSGIRNPLIRIFGIIIGLALYGAELLFLYNQHGILIFSLGPVVIFVGGACSNLIYEYFLERNERRRMQGTLERYVSKNVVDALLSNAAAYQNALGGARRRVTILFSDIRGFTTMTEKADEQELVKQLNEYLTEMVECVFTHGGTLDKFIGDAVMAVWGNVLSKGVETDAFEAVSTALAMRKALALLNERWIREGRQPLRIGIGLNHGEVIVGNMGSPRRMEFTVIGDAVNLASRLESLTKEYHVDILLGEAVAKLVSQHFRLRTVALVQVKGKTKPVEVLSVVDEINAPLDSRRSQLLDLHENGMRQYRSRAFTEAKQTFRTALGIDPSDDLSKIYLESCEEYLAHPPDVGWDGVVVMKTK
jgi:adenylate cyclase